MGRRFKRKTKKIDSEIFRRAVLDVMKGMQLRQTPNFQNKTELSIQADESELEQASNVSIASFQADDIIRFGWRFVYFSVYRYLPFFIYLILLGLHKTAEKKIGQNICCIAVISIMDCPQKSCVFVSI